MPRIRNAGSCLRRAGYTSSTLPTTFVSTRGRRGAEVSVHYDPMIAKVIAHAPTRREAIAKLDRALAGSAIAGVEHNIGYLRNVLAHRAFADGDYTTRLADDHQDELLPQDDVVGTAAGIAAWLTHRAGTDPWARAMASRSTGRPASACGSAAAVRRSKRA